MAGVWTELFRQSFTGEKTITVDHMQNVEYLDIRVIIDDEVRPDLVTRTVVDALDPKNKLAVVLESAQTGIIQILERDTIDIGDLSASQLAAFGLGDTFVLGQEYAYAEDLGASTTSSTAFVQKLRLSVSGIPAGIYRIGWCYTWNLTSTGDDFLGQIEVDDTDQLWLHRQEAKDSGADQQFAADGFAETSLSAGSHDIDLDFATSDGGETAEISQARIVFWRVQ